MKFVLQRGFLEPGTPDYSKIHVYLCVCRSEKWSTDLELTTKFRVFVGNRLNSAALAGPVEDIWYGVENKIGPPFVATNWGWALSGSGSRDAQDCTAGCHRHSIPSELIFVEYDIKRTPAAAVPDADGR